VNRFLGDFNAGKKGLVADYFAGPNEFQVWWDPTQPSGHQVEYTALEAHLAELYAAGVRIAPLVNFRSVAADPGGFTFGQTGASTSVGAPRVAAGKGKIDCNSSKLVVLVFDGW
jgi:hypothetical protein